MKDKIIKILNDKMYAYDAVHEWNQPVIMGYESAAEAILKLISSELYSIKPLEWDIVDPVHYRANTGTVAYTIFVNQVNYWELTISTGVSVQFISFQSLREAKSKAQEDWNNRISQHLTEYKEEK